MKYLAVAISVLIMFSCKEKFDSKTYTENKISLAQREGEHPEQFIRLLSDDKRNIFGTTVIKGQLINTASVAAYKNTRLKMLCYKNGIRVEEHEDVITNILKPGSTKNFKIRYRLPKGTDSLALSVMSADTLSEAIASSKK
ncbi:hypothetical protein [Parafilimonas sp.]|uniref:hypothetical protein n=1 Tax=Parafilimonas sp. TaxID=1969739 RepID=UPI0039E350DE